MSCLICISAGRHLKMKVFLTVLLIFCVFAIEAGKLEEGRGPGYMKNEYNISNSSTPFMSDRVKNFSVKVRVPGGEWREASICNARIGLRQTGVVSIASFDFSGKAEVAVGFKDKIESARIRPLRHKIPYSKINDNEISFMLDRPVKLSIEFNGDTLNNLHIFANPMEENVPDPADGKVISYKPGIHRIEGDGFLKLQSGQTLYLPYGAILKTKGIICDKVEDVRICGRGTIDMGDYMSENPSDQKRPNSQGVCATFAKNITIEGVMFLNPNHYTIFLGQCDKVKIKDIKSFSSSVWADGIDCMSTKDLDVDDVFLRTSDDCIAIYGHRWNYFGDTRNISVKNSVLWADVAHPVLIGVHGLHEKDGDIIENILIDNIDILLHDEIIGQYHGALAINAGDGNIVRNVAFSNIRIEEIRAGQILNIRVFKNESYNPKPGRRIENVLVRDVSYSGPEKISEISGYDDERMVEKLTIQNLVVNGRTVLKPEDAGIRIGKFVKDINFSR